MTTQHIPRPPEPSAYPLVDARQRREHTQQVTDILISGSKASLDVLLAQDWVKSFRDPDHDRTMLHIAARAGASRSVERLLEMGFDPNAKDNGQWTPLLLAARTFNEPTIEALLRAGADAHHKDQSGRTVLHHAAAHGGASVVQRLIKDGVQVNERDYLGATPLNLAAQGGHINNMAALIDAGADVLIKDSSGFTPFRHAMRKGHERPALLLASVGGAMDVDAGYAKLKSMKRIATDTPFRCAVLLEGFAHLRRCLEKFPEVDTKQLNWAKARFERQDDGAEEHIAFITAHIAKQRIANIASLARKASSPAALTS